MVNIKFQDGKVPFGINDEVKANSLDLEFRRNPQVFNQIGRERGGRYPHGSPIWADLYEHSYMQDYWTKTLPRMVIQVIGHSQQQKDPYIFGNIACLDCRKVFIIENNEIKEYENG